MAGAAGPAVWGTKTGEAISGIIGSFRDAGSEGRLLLRRSSVLSVNSVLGGEVLADAAIRAGFREEGVGGSWDQAAKQPSAGTATSSRRFILNFLAGSIRDPAPLSYTELR